MIDLLKHVKPNEDCIKENNKFMCDDEYVCFECESDQIKSKFPNAIWDPPVWKLKKEEEE